jgi:N-methylhydantoinase A/oxoprolinase/acetone carboxylase beta subunit
VREEEISSDYHNWKEKVRSLEGDELESFRVKMINAIRNAGKEKKEKLLKREAIERINDILSRRDLEIGDLSLSNHNYEKEINNLLPQEIEKISSIEERLIKDAERIMLKRKEEQKVKEKETMKYSEYDVVGRQEKREGGSIIKKLVGKGIEGAKKAATYIHDSDRIPRSSEYQYPTIYSPESLVKSKETISSVQNLVWQQGVRSDH